MSESSPRMQWPYPSREDDPWYDGLQDYILSADASGYAHREDGSIIWSGGGTVSWDLGTTTLTWTGTINIHSPIGARLIQIGPDSIADIADGEVIYVVLTRQPLENVSASLVKASQLPSTDNARSFAVRIGNVIYFRTGISLGDGDSSAGIAPVPGGGSDLDVEDEGVSVDPSVSVMDFVGAGVTATQTAPGEVEINIPGDFEADFADRYEYTQALVPIEETIGEGVFDGGRVGAGTAYFHGMLTPTLSIPGTASIRLYDVGPVAGPPAAAVLVATLQTATSGGPQYLEQALAVAGAPGTNQIANSARMYEVRAYETSQAGDVLFVGGGGMAVR